MSHISLTFKGTSISKKVSKISDFREYNDESVFFSGIFRRSNLSITIENTSKILDQARNNQIVELYYHPNNPKLNPFFIFQGLIDEGSTQNNLKQKQLQITVVDTLKLIEDVSIEEGDQAMIDTAYGNVNIKLDRDYIINYLNFIKTKGSLPFTFDIALTIESIFPPTDSYYDSNDISALQILEEMVKATNSFMVTERDKIMIKPRPSSTSTFTAIKNNEITSVTDQTNGFNKLYNSIIINQSDAYTDQDSVDAHGVRHLTISTYAAPTQALARTYLDYYKDPKKELNLSITMNNRNLALKVGDGVSLNIPASDNLEIQGLTGNFFIISRTLNFENEVIDIRLREN